MQRVRRLVAVATVAALGVIGLGACARSEPTVAAYVGDTTFSHQEVDRIVDEVSEEVPADQRGALRRNVVQMLVLREVATRYADEHNISVPAVDPIAFAQQQRLPVGTRFAELAAGYATAAGAVEEAAASAAPSEADQREVYSHLTVQGSPVAEPFEAIRSYLGEPQIGKAVGFRNLIRAAVEEADVVVNPRYGDVEFRVGVQVAPATSWLTVPLSGRDPAVSDVTGQS